MMKKTIEQHAEEYVKENYTRIGDMHMDKGIRTVFIESAKKQRKKDIEKACEWFSEHIIDYACYSEMNGWDIHHKEMHEDFRKAMEDE